MGNYMQAVAILGVQIPLNELMTIKIVNSRPVRFCTLTGLEFWGDSISTVFEEVDLFTGGDSEQLSVVNRFAYLGKGIFKKFA